MDGQIFTPRAAGPRAVFAKQPRLLVDKAKRHEFRESAGFF